MLICYRKQVTLPANLIISALVTAQALHNSVISVYRSVFKQQLVSSVGITVAGKLELQLSFSFFHVNYDKI